MRMRRELAVGLCLCLGVIARPAPAVADVITNGNFAAGLAGWSAFTTSGGSLVAGYPQAGTYDFGGLGTLSGVAVAAGGGSGSDFEGGGVLQTFSAPAFSEFSIGMDAVVRNTSGVTQDSGEVSISVDNGVDFGFGHFPLAPGQLNGGHVPAGGAVISVGAGTVHTIRVEYLQAQPAASGNVAYFTNVSLVPYPLMAVPEPGPLALAGLGLAGACVAALRRRQLR